MAGVSTKEIKNRIRSMESTKQITKAMEMVASSKLRRAQAQVANSRPYFQAFHNAMQDIVNSEGEFSSTYLKERTGSRVLYIVIAGDRGLAGGYNSNILKLVSSAAAGKEATVLPIGKKAVDYFRSKGIPALTENYAEAAEVSVGDCFSISKQVSRAFLEGEYDQVCVAFTKFVSMLSQEATSMQLLPLRRQDLQSEQASRHCVTVYEGDTVDVFAAIVPEYLGSILYGALCESRAAEQAARRSAMDSATQNADEMIADLSLKFNRARQAAITQEITEIVAGS